MNKNPRTDFKEINYRMCCCAYCGRGGPPV
jgi:hypothetical protein